MGSKKKKSLEKNETPSKAESTAKNEAPSKTESTVKIEKYIGRVGQGNVYFMKFLRIFIAERQWVMVITAALIAWIVAFVVGRAMFVTMEGTQLGALALACICLWNGVFNSIQVVCKERAIIKREHRSGLSITSYVASHMMIQAILCVIQTIVTIAVLAICGVHFPAQGIVTPFFLFDLFVTLFLATYASDMLGLMVSCIVHNTTIAMTVMPFILIVQLVFAGVAFPLSGFAEKLSYFTVTRHGVTAICMEANYNSLSSMVVVSPLRKVGKMIPALKEIVDEIGEDTIAEFTGEFVQDEKYEASPGRVLVEWALLLAFSAGFALLGWVVLKFIDHDKR